MNLKILDHFTDINPDDWDRLVEQNETNVPFLRYGYLQNWWAHKGGGEWPENSDLILIAGLSVNQLVGIAPLFTPAVMDEKKLLLLGSIEISDYLDIICLPEHKEEFILELLNFIAQDMKEIQKMEWINLPETSTTLHWIKGYSEKVGWNTEVEQAYHTPAIKLAADWDLYLSGIDKKQRHEIRRKMRRAEENSDSIQWYIVKEPDQLDSGIQAFFLLMENDPDKKKFLTPQMRIQMSEICHWAFNEGFLQLSFLQIGQSKAAGYLCFDYGKHLLVYNSGFDYQFSEYSPGWVLLSYLIRHAIETGKSHFDFMRGDETYKYRFGAEDSFVMRARFTRV